MHMRRGRLLEMPFSIRNVYRIWKSLFNFKPTEIYFNKTQTENCHNIFPVITVAKTIVIKKIIHASTIQWTTPPRIKWIKTFEFRLYFKNKRQTRWPIK